MMIFNGTLKTCNWRWNILIRFCNIPRWKLRWRVEPEPTAVRQMWFWLDRGSESSWGSDFDFIHRFEFKLLKNLLESFQQVPIIKHSPENNFMFQSTNKPQKRSFINETAEKDFVKIHSYRLRTLSLPNHSMCSQRRCKVLFMSNLVARQRWMWMCY